MKLLFLNWKDINHPDTGGAETVTHEIAKKFVQNGHQVTLLTARYSGSSATETLDGVEVIRVGNNKYIHYLAAVNYYRKNLKDKYDVIVEQINTIPYLINLAKGKEKVVLYYNMLCRVIWFYQMVFPFSLIGWLIEPVYTFLQSRFANRVLTISESSKQDLMRFGFDAQKIDIFSMGILNEPLNKPNFKKKQAKFTVLFHGSLRKMKRPLEVFKAYETFLEKLDDDQKKHTQLWVSGSGLQKQDCYSFAKKNGFLEKVTFFGRVTEQQKLDLMRKASCLATTSIKEGWGLIVTESNSMATPAVVYDVDGLRDAANCPGNFVVKNNHTSLAEKIYELYQIFVNEPKQYQTLCRQVLENSKKITFENGYKEFAEAIENA